MSSQVSSLEIQALHVNRSVKFDCAKLSIKQSFTPNWSSEPAYGKMDNIATYANTTRGVTFNFTCLAKQEDSAVKLKRDVDVFAQMQYPLYTTADRGRVLRAPPFFKIKSLNGKMYNDFEGYIESFDIVPGSEAGTTPLVALASGLSTFAERRYDITISLIVMHSENPGFIDQDNFSSGDSFYFSSGENTPSAQPINVDELVNSGLAAINNTAQNLNEQLGAYSNAFNTIVEDAKNIANDLAGAAALVADDQGTPPPAREFGIPGNPFGDNEF